MKSLVVRRFTLEQFALWAKGDPPENSTENWSNLGLALRLRSVKSLSFHISSLQSVALMLQKVLSCESLELRFQRRSGDFGFIRDAVSSLPNLRTFTVFDKFPNPTVRVLQDDFLEVVKSSDSIKKAVLHAETRPSFQDEVDFLSQLKNVFGTNFVSFAQSDLWTHVPKSPHSTRADFWYRLLRERPELVQTVDHAIQPISSLGETSA